jgi:DNA-binding transcriptional regulator YhcF (GntR family)
MDSSLVNHYARMADGFNRDPYGPDGGGRATVVNGRGFQMWRRFNPNQELVWIDDMEGNPKAITPKQRDVLEMALSMIEGEMLTMRQMAARLNVAPSTVSRAMTKFSSWGIIAYVVGRGRWAGLVIMRRAKGDGLDRFRKAARERVKRWREAAERRVSRLEMNVASYLGERVRGKEVDSLYYYLTTISKDATLKPWTADDMAEIV